MEGPRVHRDRLSELPVSLIHHIFSFLPMRDVVSTTLLSKRWENLWTTVPCLNFFEYVDEDEDVQREADRLQHFVNQALMFWKGVKILKFKIEIMLRPTLSLASHVNVWIRFAVNHKVEELKIITCGGYWEWDLPQYKFPSCLNSCSSLKKLSLLGFNVQSIGYPSWNQLKSLKIDVAYGSPFSGDMVNRILLCSPELEVFELHLIRNSENLNICSTSLKKLKIKNQIEYLMDLSMDRSSLPTLRICCPNLEKLEILGLFGKCLFTDLSSLVDASFHFYYEEPESENLAEVLEETVKQVFSTIQNAEKVTLTSHSIKVLGASHKRYLRSPLPNVKFLKLDLYRIEFGDMIYVLENFPNVKRLVIDQLPKFDAVNYVELESNLFKSFLLELKTVEISSYFCDVSIFGFIEFLLKQAVKLEKVVLRSYGGFAPCNKEKLFQISEKLLNMPRSSPTAKMIVKISETYDNNRRVLLTIVREK